MTDDTELGGFPLIGAWNNPGVPDRGGGAPYAEMIEDLRDFLDRVAAAKPDEVTTQALAADLARWSARLAPLAVPETEQIFAHRHDLPGRGQVMSPAFIVEDGDAQEVHGHVTMGRYYLGGNGAVHGGAVALLFDEVLGRMAGSGGRDRSRTAYLHVNYRSITPIDKKLQVRGWFVSEEGRKRLLRAEIRDGETLCADAEGLFVQLKPGQP